MTEPSKVAYVFPGQGAVTAMPVAGPTAAGLLALEANTGGTVKYSFVASQPGTYMYHSGTRPELQVEMGLLGALIVRPTGFDQNDPTKRTAYGHQATAYDDEYLMLLSEMDPNIHDLVDFGFADFVDNTTFFPKFWFINGRNAVDTLQWDNVAFLPNQPYSSLVITQPGKKVLIRFIGAGRDLHAFHPHGNHAFLMAVDGRMISSDPTNSPTGPGPDVATEDYTFTPTPGSTMDAIFSWTSKGLGWDIYGDPTEAGFGHTCNGEAVNPTPGVIDPASGEDCTYHGVRLDSKVVLPGLQDITIGATYSGSPFLGHFGELPPGEGGLNPFGAFFFPWHNHNEKTLLNNDIFLGGMLTFVLIAPGP